MALDRPQMDREPVEATRRRSMTPARRRAVLIRAGLCCQHPGCVMSQGLEIDHIIPLELGGLDEDANLQALCYTHHKSKTKADIKRIAKARRLRNKKPPDPNRLGQIRSRGFDKSKTKGFDGRVRARQSPPDRPDS